MELHHTQIKEEKGFSAVEMLLSLIAVVLIVFVGYYVWHTQKAADKTLTAASQTASTPAPKVVKKVASTAPVTTTAPADTSSYLVIKEWGVKLKLDPAIKDASYAPYGAADTDMGLGVDTLTKLAPECGPKGTTLGLLARQTAAEHDANKRDQAANGANISNMVYTLKVGDFYYQYIHPQAGCYDGGNTAAANYDKTVDPYAKLKAAVDTIQAAN